MSFGITLGAWNPFGINLAHHRLRRRLGRRRRWWRRRRWRRWCHQHTLQLRAWKRLRIDQRNQDQNNKYSRLDQHRQKNGVLLLRLYCSVNECLFKHFLFLTLSPWTAGYLLIKQQFLFTYFAVFATLRGRLSNRHGSRSSLPLLRNVLPENQYRTGDKDRRVSSNNNTDNQRK